MLLITNFYEDKSSENIIRRLELASGNPGFELTKMAKTPEDYPTVQVNGGVNGGKCVKLTTKDTGSFGSMVKMYIAAGIYSLAHLKWDRP